MVRQLFPLFLIITLLAAEPHEAPLQAGYRAWLAGETAQAVMQYEQALRVSNDPGAIALELGSLQASSGNYLQAAGWFARCLEDARGLRRLRAAYGHATALTHVGSNLAAKRAVAMLRQAIQSYELVKREAAGVSEAQALLADAEHNLAIAQGLLAQKLQEPEPPEDMNDTEPAPSIPQPLNNSDAAANTRRGATPLAGKNDPGESNGGAESQAGRGNLPPLPDEDKLPPISAEEAQRRLQELLDRLRRPLGNTTPRPGSKDW
jgi:hypothetical protein